MNYAKLFTKRRDGRYVATIVQDGKRRYLYDKDPEALYKKLEDAKATGPLTMGKIVEAWREEHSRNVGFKTAESYVAPCRRIVEDFGDDIPGKISAARIQAFITALGKRGYARRTVQLHYDILSMVFSYCLLHGYAQVSPMDAVSIPKGLRSEKRTVPEDDALAAVKARTDVPLAPLALICLYAGLRRGEALALRQEDIDRKARVIHVTKDVEYGIHSAGASFNEAIMPRISARRSSRSCFVTAFDPGSGAGSKVNLPIWMGAALPFASTDNRKKAASSLSKTAQLELGPRVSRYCLAPFRPSTTGTVHTVFCGACCGCGIPGAGRFIICCSCCS